MERVDLGTPARAALEEERDFLLRSLRDLEAERQAGDIDDVDYYALKDSYVARAASVLHELEAEDGAPRVMTTAAAAARVAETAQVAETARAAGVAKTAGAARAAGAQAVQPTQPLDPLDPGDPVDPGDPGEPRDQGEPAPPVPKGWSRRRVVFGGLVVVVATAGTTWAVVASSGSRLPGQEITGQALGSVSLAQTLQTAQQAADRGDDVTALKNFQKVLAAEANQPQALTGEGWILAQTQQPKLLQQGLTMLAAAEAAEPSYPPAHLYRGIALLSEDNYAGSIPELRWYLGHSPDPQLVSRVRLALSQAEASAAAAKPSG